MWYVHCKGDECCEMRERTLRNEVGELKKEVGELRVQIINSFATTLLEI